MVPLVLRVLDSIIIFSGIARRSDMEPIVFVLVFRRASFLQR